MDWYLKALKNYVSFSGRARRREYWNFVLFNALIAVVLSVVDGQLGQPVLAPLYILAVLLPGLAVSVRRLHDTGRSGWWLLISLVPIVGGIILLVFMFLDSEPGANRYGMSPKHGAIAEPPPAVA